MTLRSGLLVVLMSSSAITAGSSAAAADATACDSDLCTLTKTLAAFNLADPISDLEKNLKVGDVRFIGIRGYSCTAPGADEADEPWMPRFERRCLAGTSDLVEGQAHRELIAKAMEYARTYNIELLRRIRAGLVT